MIPNWKEILKNDTTEKMILSSIIKDVVVYDDKIDIHLRINFKEFSETAKELDEKLRFNVLKKVLKTWVTWEPASISPTWVHFDRRFGNPACRTGGYPTIRQGSRGNYVWIAQDDLNTLGFRTGG